MAPSRKPVLGTGGGGGGERGGRGGRVQQGGLFSLVLNLLVSQRASIGDCVAPVLPHLVPGQWGADRSQVRCSESLVLPSVAAAGKHYNH